MALSLWLWRIETVFLCPVYDGWQGNLLSVFVIKLVLDIAVVIKSDRHILVFNESLFQAQFFDNVLLDFLIYLSGNPLSVVGEREAIRIISVFFKELKEPTPLIEDEEVIKKILKHLGLWKIKARPRAKANANILRVAKPWFNS